jgi:hypothetical protein
MAVSGSGLFCATILDVFDATGTVINLITPSTAHKWAMFTNTITPNFTTDTAYAVAPYNANEVSGAGYTAGGTVVASPTFTASAGIVTYDQADTSWAASTITNARAGLLYADALAGNFAICLVDFAADYSTVNGTFLITWNALGVFTIDLVP